MKVTIEEVEDDDTSDANAQLDVGRVLRQIVAKDAMRGSFILDRLFATISRVIHLGCACARGQEALTKGGKPTWTDEISSWKNDGSFQAWSPLLFFLKPDQPVGLKRMSLRERGKRTEEVGKVSEIVLTAQRSCCVEVPTEVHVERGTRREEGKAKVGTCVQAMAAMRCRRSSTVPWASEKARRSARSFD